MKSSAITTCTCSMSSSFVQTNFKASDSACHTSYHGLLESVNTPLVLEKQTLRRSGLNSRTWSPTRMKNNSTLFVAPLHRVTVVTVWQSLKTTFSLKKSAFIYADSSGSHFSSVSPRHEVNTENRYVDTVTPLLDRKLTHFPKHGNRFSTKFSLQIECPA